MTEAEFQARVLSEARARGWRAAHFRAARTQSGGWATPVTADAAGFPDLVLAHPRHGVIFAELKTASGRVRPAQRAWLDLLNAAGARAVVWRPGMEREITSALRGRYDQPPDH